MGCGESARKRPGGLSRAVAEMRSQLGTQSAPSHPSCADYRTNFLTESEAESSAPSFEYSSPESALDIASGLAELRKLLESDSSLSSPSTLAVSPPLRSGAANPLTHDLLWREIAADACHVHLRALEELRVCAPCCLGSGVSCWGDFALLSISPSARGACTPRVQGSRLSTPSPSQPAA